MMSKLERIKRAAHGWNEQYPAGWRAMAHSRVEGLTDDELRAANTLGFARHEVYITLCRTYGDPAYGGGGYSNDEVDAQILEWGTKPNAARYLAEAAAVLTSEGVCSKAA